MAISKNEVVIPQKVMLQALTVTNTGEPTTDETVLKNYVTSLSKKYDTNDTARSFKSTKKVKSPQHQLEHMDGLLILLIPKRRFLTLS